MEADNPPAPPKPEQEEETDDADSERLRYIANLLALKRTIPNAFMDGTMEIIAQKLTEALVAAGTDIANY